jgi:hypothetical protein
MMRPVYVLRLTPLPGVDPVRALRWLLKGLLRQAGMRCLEAREEGREEWPAEPTPSSTG